MLTLSASIRIVSVEPELVSRKFGGRFGSSLRFVVTQLVITLYSLSDTTACNDPICFQRHSDSGYMSLTIIGNMKTENKGSIFIFLANYTL